LIDKISKKSGSLLKNKIRIGVFHPSFNFGGGAEWVAVNVINALKKANYQTIILTNSRVDQTKLLRLFGTKANIDQQVIFPLEIAAQRTNSNIYSDFIRTLLLKSKCDIVIDTSSSSKLPGVDISYVHYPLLGLIPKPKSSKDYARKFRNLFYFPFSVYQKSQTKTKKPILLANSKYTIKGIRKITGSESTLLYPPISRAFFINDYFYERNNTVVSVGRITPQKRFHLIPLIARLTSKNINFLIIGPAESRVAINQIRELARINNVADRVQILADISRDQLKEILRTSKVFLHTMVDEHFGVSIVEALASGCVTVVHDSGGPKEFVPIKFRFDTVEKAAEIIEKAIIEWTPPVAHEFTLLAKQFSEETFSEKFMSIVKSFIADKKILA
jgi:alpha-1,2-mannosyltransferase